MIRDIDYPDVVAVYLTGQPAAYVGPRMWRFGDYRRGIQNGVKSKVMEFVDGIRHLSTDFRRSIDVMTTETTCLSSVWQTDEEAEAGWRCAGREQDYRPRYIRSRWLLRRLYLCRS